MPKPHITPAGLALLWGGAGLAVAGAIRFDGMLILLGLIGLTALGLARFWAPRNLRGVRVERNLPFHVFAGEPFEIRLSLSLENGRKIDAFSVSARDTLLPRGERGWLWAGRIPADGGPASGSIRTRIFRRGVERRRQFELVSTFPLGLFEVRQKGSYPKDSSIATPGLTVFPRPLLPGHLRKELELAQYEVAHQHGIDPEPGGDFRGVRAWRPGDPLRAIHWPATARMGSIIFDQEETAFSTLMVRDWDPPGPKPQRFGILFHSYSEGGGLIRPDRFEMALRIVGGLLNYCRNAEIPVSFIPLLRIEPQGSEESGSTLLQIPERTGATQCFALLARAKRIPGQERSEVIAAAQKLAGCERIFAISDSPLASWQGAIDTPDRTVVCVDPDTLEIERPRLRLRPGRTRAR